MSTASTTSPALDTLVERSGLKTLVEACLVLEEGIAGVKDIDIGMMAGAGILPGPFARADERGLDDVLEALERAQAEWGDGFEPPRILRRLVAQGRLGKTSELFKLSYDLLAGLGVAPFGLGHSFGNFLLLCRCDHLSTAYHDANQFTGSGRQF